MTQTKRIIQRRANLIFAQNELPQGPEWSAETFVFGDNSYRLAVLFAEGIFKTGAFSRLRGEISDFDPLLDVFLQFAQGKNLRELSLLSAREIENFLRDQNHQPAIHDQKMLAELDKLLEKVKNNVYNLARVNSPHKSHFLGDENFESLSLVKKIEVVEEILTAKIRPTLAQDQGDIELLELDETRIIMAYKGACGTCPSSKTGTLEFIQKIFREELRTPELSIVIEE